MVLCVRSDDPSDRHFDGQLAYLGLYDVALNETQVRWVGGSLRACACTACLYCLRSRGIGGSERVATFQSPRICLKAVCASSSSLSLCRLLYREVEDNMAAAASSPAPPASAELPVLSPTTRSGEQQQNGLTSFSSPMH